MSKTLIHCPNLFELIADKVRELAEAYPDAIYQPHNGSRCFYTKGAAMCGNDELVPGAGCIIGRALLEVFPEFEEDLREFDDFAEQGFNDFCGEFLDNHFDLDAALHTKEQRLWHAWLLEVQIQQDDSVNWRTAISAADRYRENSLSGPGN